MAVGYNPSIVTDSLSVYLDAGNRKSYPGTGTELLDLSGNAVNATVNGSPAFTNGYFTITGDTTYISMPNATLIPRVNNFAYSIWVWFNSIDGLDTLIENGSWTDSLLFRAESNVVTVYAEGASLGSMSWTRATSRWYNVAFVRSNNTLSMYVDGVLTGTPLAMSTDINLANPSLWLMRSQHSTGQFVNGRFAAFSVYNIELTPPQVVQNFNALRGRFGI
jgi:hypothetical protein